MQLKASEIPTNTADYYALQLHFKHNINNGKRDDDDAGQTHKHEDAVNYSWLIIL